jgi:hypothetical protein
MRSYPQCARHRRWHARGQASELPTAAPGRLHPSLLCTTKRHTTKSPNLQLQPFLFETSWALTTSGPGVARSNVPGLLLRANDLSFEAITRLRTCTLPLVLEYRCNSSRLLLLISNLVHVEGATT